VRLAGAHDLSLIGIQLGSFCERSLEALQRFQRRRGLPVLEYCDDATWQTLVESTWALGSRLLYLTSPHLRGDDVEQLQVRLARLGFNCGKADGIFGPLTADGLSEFQQNYGLEIDGICGPLTLKAMERIGGQSGDGPGVVVVREDEMTRAINSASLSVAVGACADMHPLATHVARALRARGHRALIIESNDHHRHSLAANSFRADLYLGFEHGDAPSIAFYKTEGFSSPAGERVATLLSATIPGGPPVRGMRSAVLRETRMPAVLCTVGEVPADLVHSAETLAGVVEVWWSEAH
jgi:N-acetylmuramoyl-L-alanine amidase